MDEYKSQLNKSVAAEARRDCQYASQPTVDYKNTRITGEIASSSELGMGNARANQGPDPCIGCQNSGMT